MKPNESRGSDYGGQFRTTHWSVVLLSAQSQVSGSQRALADLCQLYWYPLYAFVRRRGYSAEDAQDLTQGFFLSLLERKSLRRVGPEKGKFRSFLLASLKNYLFNAFDRENSIKRGGQIEFVTLDFESGEERYREDAGDSLAAEKIFDARWAMTLLDHALGRLGKEYALQGKTAIMDALRPFLDPINCKRLPSYEEVAEKNQTQTLKLLLNLVTLGLLYRACQLLDEPREQPRFSGMIQGPRLRDRALPPPEIPVTRVKEKRWFTMATDEI